MGPTHRRSTHLSSSHEREKSVDSGQRWWFPFAVDGVPAGGVEAEGEGEVAGGRDREPVAGGNGWAWVLLLDGQFHGTVGGGDYPGKWPTE